jgi:C-terminal processing protease CtpA/Prc
MGIVIQRIEPQGRVYKDGRLKAGDRIIEINQESLIGVDFVRSQEILRDALKCSTSNGDLNLKIVRNTCLDVKSLNLESIESDHSNFNNNYFQEKKNKSDIKEILNNNELTLSDYYNNPDNFPNDNDEEFNERPIEIEFEHKENTNGDVVDNKRQCSSAEIERDDFEEETNAKDYNNTNNPMHLSSYSSSINMNALNTKKLGKKVTVQLIKGPQGLGFKLAARDNCSNGEFSPIYIKNILPKGAAIADGRLQRGDRLLKVNKMDMTQKTLHEAVNILRDTKLGSCVELVISRQVLPQASSGANLHQSTSHLTQTSCGKELNGIAAAKLPREMSMDDAIVEIDQTLNAGENENNQEQNLEGGDLQSNSMEVANSNKNKTNRRQLLTFEIALNDTGSAGLGVSVLIFYFSFISQKI